MAFDQGALVRAEFTGTVITAGGSRDFTSKVRGPDGRTHLLALSNQEGRRAVLANAFAFTRQPERGATVRVRLAGKVTGRPDALLSGAQPVRADGYYGVQYLNPGSDYVQLADTPGGTAAAGRVPDGTKLDVSFAGTVVSRETGTYSTRSGAAAGYAEGDTVTVKFTGRVISDRNVNSTALVAEDNGKLHYLYLPAGLATPRGRQAAGTVIEVSFRARLKSRSPGGAGGRREVYAIGPGYTHYLDMSSPSVTRLDADGRPTGKPAEADPLAAACAELAKRTSFRGDEVRGEIESLTGGLLTWAARRVRNAEVLKQDFADKTEAESWIEDNDYDPRRVEAVQVETGDPPPELAALRELDELGDGITEDWEGGDEVVRGDQFTAAYARDQFREDLDEEGCGVDLEEWPLNLVDWDKAAESLKAGRESFEWAGQTWYSRDWS